MKRYISLILALLFVATVPVSSYANAALLGDINDDGVLDSLDYIALKSYMKDEAAFEINLAIADTTGDGALSTTDLILLKQAVTGSVELNCIHSYTDWAKNGEYNCLGNAIIIRSCTLCGNTEYGEDANSSQYTSLDGKTVMFIGNSFIYYGYCVNKGSQKSTDKGYFYQACKANGEDVKVYDYVWGGQNLDYIYSTYLVDCTESFLSSVDYVFMSEAGENNSALVTDVSNIMALFPNSKTKFYYLCHAYTYQKSHTNITNAFTKLQDKGVDIINWGQLVYNVWQGTEKVPGATLTYNKNSFIVNKNDTHHQNMLSGYITAQMTYCAVTGKSAVGQSYAYCTDTSINSNYDPASYITSYYNTGTTNFDKVFASKADMLGFQQLMDEYLGKYSISVSEAGAHSYKAHIDSAYDTALATSGLTAEKCEFCGEIKLNEIAACGSNSMYVSADTVKAAGYTTVKEYMLAGLGNVFYKSTSGWGRAGYSSIQGMAAACDGVRESKALSDGTELYWLIKDVNSAVYNADSDTPASGEKAYISLIGYDMTNAVSTNGIGIYFNKLGAPTAFDVLGGVTQADGSIKWTVLTSFDKQSEFMKYSDSTIACFADIDVAEIDCLQLAIVSSDTDTLYISEIELYN